MPDSCLAVHLSNFVDLTEAEERLLGDLEKEPASYSGGTEIYAEGEALDQLFIVNEGWLASSTMLVDGDRQILQLHYTGDLVGAAEVSLQNSFSTLTTLTNVTLCRFPRSELGELFAKQPRLAALIYGMGMINNVILADRLKALGRTNAKARIANLLMSIIMQIRLMSGDGDISFDMPLTQIEIADAVGLTPVHVSRVLGELERQGIIERASRRIQLCDEKRLSAIAQYDNRFSDLDTKWLPSA